jgi:hypothetical protein
MPGFLEECAMLAPLESFDPEAFRGNAEVPQALCNFVLAIALIYNDCKDAIHAHVALAGSKPEGPPLKTRAWGALGGAQFHAFRAVAALLHELFELIRTNRDLLRHDFFVSLMQQLHPVSRKAWLALVNVACDATPTDQLGKRLLLLRNKVFFHYDPKAIFQGYTQHFLGTTKRDDRAYLSRGDSMRATRFYFADAAAEGYLHFLVGPEKAEELKKELGEIIGQVNHGLMMIVGSYIQRRGYSFRAEAES